MSALSLDSKMGAEFFLLSFRQSAFSNNTDTSRNLFIKRKDKHKTHSITSGAPDSLIMPDSATRRKSAAPRKDPLSAGVRHPQECSGSRSRAGSRDPGLGGDWGAVWGLWAGHPDAWPRL